MVDSNKSKIQSISGCADSKNMYLEALIIKQWKWQLTYCRRLVACCHWSGEENHKENLYCKCWNHTAIEFFTIGVFVRLSDRSLHREEQKNFVKNCPQWGWKPGLQDLQANALPTELGRNLLGRRFLKWALFVSCTTSHVGLCSFLESIEHDFIKAMKIQAGSWMLTYNSIDKNAYREKTLVFLVCPGNEVMTTSPLKGSSCHQGEGPMLYKSYRSWTVMLILLIHTPKLNRVNL